MYSLHLVVLVTLLYVTHNHCAIKKQRFKSGGYWKQLARSQGPNVCVREVIPRLGRSYDRAWTGGSFCGMRTVVKFQCCEGYGMVSAEQGCPLVKPQVSLFEAAETVEAGMFLKLQETAGLSEWLDSRNQGAVTVLAPLNKALKKLPPSKHFDINYQVQRVADFLESPALLLHHTLQGRVFLKTLPSDSMVPSLHRAQLIRFNVFPSELITANCIPITESEIHSSQGLLYVLEAPLDTTPLYNIADFIAHHSSLRRLATFISQADFGKILRLSGPFTFFAPTDEAFSEIPESRLQELLYNEEALKALVNHHLVEGVQCSAALYNITLHTLGGTMLKPRCTPKGTRISGANIIKGNIMASNGVVHFIDRVLIPRRAKTLMELLSELGLTKLKELLPTAGLQSALRGRGPITVFAPNNQALSEFGNSTLMELRNMELRNLLAGHMVSGRQLIRNLLDKQALQSLSQSKTLRLKLYATKSLVNNAVIVRPDIEGSNGVIHIINKVLMPPKFSIIKYLQSRRKFGRFLRALSRTSPSLIELLESDNAPFTVFAVSDDSIDDWSADLFAYDRMMADPRIVNSIMRNHVIPDTLFTSGLVPGNYYQMMNLNSEPLLVRRWHGQNGPVYAGISLIEEPDILCTNGVIHVVNRLIQLANPSYS